MSEEKEDVEEKFDKMLKEGMTIMAAIKNIQENGYNDEEYEILMEKGLTKSQKQVVEKYIGEGRIHVDDSDIPKFIDKIMAGKRIPWSFKLDGIWFIVKADHGVGSHPHSEWSWFEDDYKIRFFRAQRDNCVDGVIFHRKEDYLD